MIHTLVVENTVQQMSMLCKIGCQVIYTYIITYVYIYIRIPRLMTLIGRWDGFPIEMLRAGRCQILL